MTFGRLRVVANPYNGGHRALDHKGRAAACVPHLVDAAKGLTSRTHFVGARLDEKAMAEFDRIVGYDGEKPVMAPTLALTHDEGAIEDIACPDLATYEYYKRKLQDGDLLPADEATARKTGTLAQRAKLKDGQPVFDRQGRPVLEGCFVPAGEALAAAKQRAIKEFAKEHGFTPACATATATASSSPSAPSPDQDASAHAE